MLDWAITAIRWIALDRELDYLNSDTVVVITITTAAVDVWALTHPRIAHYVMEYGYSRDDYSTRISFRLNYYCSMRC